MILEILGFVGLVGILPGLLGIAFGRRRIVCRWICGSSGCGLFLLAFFRVLRCGFRMLFRIVLVPERIFALFCEAFLEFFLLFTIQ